MPIWRHERLNEKSRRAGIWPAFSRPPRTRSASMERRRRAIPRLRKRWKSMSRRPDADGAGGAAADNEEPEAPNARRRFLPSSVGLTVLLDPGCDRDRRRASPGATIEPNRRCRRTSCFPSRRPKRSARTARPKRIERPLVDWVRARRSASSSCRSERRAAAHRLSCRKARPSSGGAVALTLETHSRAVQLSRRRMARPSASAR